MAGRVVWFCHRYRRVVRGLTVRRRRARASRLRARAGRARQRGLESALGAGEHRHRNEALGCLPAGALDIQLLDVLEQMRMRAILLEWSPVTRHAHAPAATRTLRLPRARSGCHAICLALAFLTLRLPCAYERPRKV